jgi:hypothetical protein
MEQQTLYSFLDKLAEKYPDTEFVVTMVTQNGESGGRFLPDGELTLSQITDDGEDDHYWGIAYHYWGIVCCGAGCFDIDDQDLVIDSNDRIVVKMKEFSSDVYLTLFKKELVQIRF